MQTTNKLILHASHDYEDTIEGTQFLYRVASCDVDNKTGTLTWDRMIFPTSGPGPCREMMISQANPKINHVRDMQIIGDDVIKELRERGVEVKILS